MKWSYIWTADKDRIIWISSQWRCLTLSSWKEETWKNSGLDENRTHDLCDTGAALYSFLHLWDKYELSIDQLPVGLIAQLVRALHWYHRGHGFDSRSSLNFFRFLLFNCLSWKTFTAMIFIYINLLKRYLIFHTSKVRAVTYGKHSLGYFGP